MIIRTTGSAKRISKIKRNVFKIFPITLLMYHKGLKFCFRRIYFRHMAIAEMLMRRGEHAYSSEAYAQKVKTFLTNSGETVQLIDGFRFTFIERGYMTVHRPEGDVTVRLGSVKPLTPRAVDRFFGWNRAQLMCEAISETGETVPFRFRFSSGLSMENNLALLSDRAGTVATDHF